VRWHSEGRVEGALASMLDPLMTQRPRRPEECRRRRSTPQLEQHGSMACPRRTHVRRRPRRHRAAAEATLSLGADGAAPHFSAGDGARLGTIRVFLRSSAASQLYSVRESPAPPSADRTVLQRHFVVRSSPIMRVSGCRKIGLIRSPAEVSLDLLDPLAHGREIAIGAAPREEV
jgi:hypothetical protein